MKKNELINLHFSLGLLIRNLFGLHERGNKLMKPSGFYTADDCSMELIEKLWEKLNTESKYTEGDTE